MSSNIFGLPYNEKQSNSEREKILQEYDSIGRSLAYQMPDSAILYMHKALKIARSLELWDKVQKSYSNMAVVYQMTGRYDSAHAMLHHADQLYDAAGDSSQFGPIAMVKGNLLSVKGEHEKALATYKQALNHYLKTEQFERAAGAASNMALGYELLGYFNLATEAIYEAMDYYKKSGKPLEDPQLWNTLGNVHNTQHNYEESLKAFRLTFKFASAQENYLGISIAASNLANTFSKMGVPDSALHYIEIARDYAGRVDNIHTLYVCDRIEAQVHEFKGDYSTGRKVIQKSLNSGRGEIRPALYAELLQTLIALQLKDENVPISEINESLKAFKDLGVENLPIIYQREYHRLSGSFLESTDDFKGALKSFKAYRMLHDSIWNIEKSNRINELNIQFESLKKDTELDLLRKEQLLANIQIANQRTFMFIIGGGSALLACFGLAGFLLYRQRQRNKTLSESIASRDYERNRLSRELHDGVASELYGIQMAIEGGLYANDAAALNLQLSRIRDDVRHISHDLAMPDIQHTTLPEMATYLVDRWRHIGRKLSITIEPENPATWQILPDKALHLYRILQEGLTNALRYSKADREVKVELMLSKGEVKLEIINHYIETLVGDGPSGIGLKNLEERAELIGGSATITMDDEQAKLLVKIPLK